MLSKKLTTAAVGISAALSMTGAPAAHAAKLFEIGVAANFGNAVQDVITDFLNAYNLSGTIGTKIDSTANLKTCILTLSTATNFTTNCPVGAYDLFLSADESTPVGLPTTVEMVYTGTTPATQTPFFYAQGSIVLYSTSTDISAGLPSTFTVPFVIADPSKAPYGFAAMTVLNTPPWSLALTSGMTYPPTTTGQASFVHTAPNIGSTYNDVVAPGGYAYGFVAKSYVCTASSNGTQNFTTVGFHHEYLFNSTTNPYPEIVQYGLSIEQGQTATKKAMVVSFAQFLQGNPPNFPATSPVPSTQGVADILSFCYTTPAQ
jgi:molybdate transport system substrate-binding protein